MSRQTDAPFGYYNFVNRVRRDIGVAGAIEIPYLGPMGAFQVRPRARSIHVHVAAAAPPHDPGFQTVIFPDSPGYALYPSVQVAAWQRGSVVFA